MQYHFHRFCLDTAHFAMYEEGKKLHLEPQVLRLLQYLIENRDRVVSRTELLDKVFGRRIVSDNALTVRIRTARRSVDDTAQSQKVIATIQGGGYRFVADVRTRAHTAFLRQPSVISGFSEEDAEEFGRPIPDDLFSARPSIAVLPFEVIGGDEPDSVIARGLAHDVTTRIARSRAMLVIARSTAFQFPSGGCDVRKIGIKLGVRYVAQGAAQPVGGRIRITVGLASTETREELASWQYDRKLDDVLVLQEEIAKLIVSALETEVTQQEMQRSTLIPSSNLDAWSAYHRGLSHMYRFRMKDCDRAETFFRSAIDLEPNVPRPYSGLSFVHYERAYLDLEGCRASSLRRSLDYALQAIDIDPMDPMGHWALSRARFLEGNLGAARKSVMLSTELNPSYATAQYFLGWVAVQSGDHELCLERIDLARRLSPFDPLIYGMLGVSALSLVLMGRHEEAIQRAIEALQHPDVHYQAHAWAVAIFTIADRPDLASDSLKHVLAVNPDYGFQEFFSAHAFQNDDDVRQITQAFQEAKRYHKH